MNGYVTAGLFAKVGTPISITREADTLWFRSNDCSLSLSVDTTAAERARIRELLDEIDAEEAAKAGA